MDFERVVYWLGIGLAVAGLLSLLGSSSSSSSSTYCPGCGARLCPDCGTPTA